MHNNKRYGFFCFVMALLILPGCKKYIDIIPDNVATIDHAFATRATTQRYLTTCYAGLPLIANAASNPAFLGGEEFWTWNIFSFPENTEFRAPFRIGNGQQNAGDPILNYYEGDLFKTMRKCNTFIEKVDGVFELTAVEKAQWKAEAKVIKAYCMFYLTRMYGPIPIVKESLPIYAEPEEIRYKRSKFDDCIQYITQLIDEAAPSLLERIQKPGEELGRITKPAALAIKADVLVLAASPQFNGNPYYAGWANKDGELLFGPKDDSKWAKAVQACKEAITAAEAYGARLYKEPNLGGALTAPMLAEYTHRAKVSSETWSPELLWSDVNVPTEGLQRNALPRLDGRMTSTTSMHTLLGVNMKVANEFYSAHGVPIDQDKDWGGKNLTELRAATPSESGLIKGTTANINFDREPRFYATIGFDRGVWYGNGNGNGQEGLNPWIVLGLKGEATNKNGSQGRCIVTGYSAKKLVNIATTMTPTLSITVTRYPFPIYRLADLYLLYAEAQNEANGPGAEAYAYIDSVRNRAGLENVVASWAKYSNKPALPTSKSGLRQIIQRERMIELAFEGKRFWDLRRWLLAETEMNKPVTGWNINSETRESYYVPRTLYLPRFTPRDYLWPIRKDYLLTNPALVQAPGW